MITKKGQERMPSLKKPTKKGASKGEHCLGENDTRSGEEKHEWGENRGSTVYIFNFTHHEHLTSSVANKIEEDVSRAQIQNMELGRWPTAPGRGTEKLDVWPVAFCGFP